MVKALRFKPEGRGFDSRWCHWNCSLAQFFRPHYGPGIDSASKRNEYQKCFLRGRGGRCVGLTFPPSYAVLKSGSLNLLEPSGPIQACKRTYCTLLYCIVQCFQSHCFLCSVLHPLFYAYCLFWVISFSYDAFFFWPTVIKSTSHL